MDSRNLFSSLNDSTNTGNSDIQLTSTLLDGVGPQPTPVILQQQFSFSGFSSDSKLTPLDMPAKEVSTVNQIFESTFTYNPNVNNDISNSTPPLKKKPLKPLKLILPDPSQANGSFANELEQTDPPKFKVIQLTKTQKNSHCLIIEQDGHKRKYAMASKGVTKGGVCTWICSNRKCKSQIKTKFDKNHLNFIGEKLVGGRKRFFLDESSCNLQTNHFRPFEQNQTAHVCVPMSEKDLYNHNIGVEAKDLTGKMADLNPIRKPLRGEILDAATDTVHERMPEPTSPLNIKKLNIARKISRAMKKHDKDEADIDKLNRAEYTFSSYYTSGKIKLDVEFAQKTANTMLLFYYYSVLSLLGTGDFSFLGDGTFPMGKGGLYEQVFIGLITNNQNCYCKTPPERFSKDQSPF